MKVKAKEKQVWVLICPLLSRTSTGRKARTVSSNMAYPLCKVRNPTRTNNSRLRSFLNSSSVLFSPSGVEWNRKKKTDCLSPYFSFFFFFFLCCHASVEDVDEPAVDRPATGHPGGGRNRVGQLQGGPRQGRPVQAGVRPWSTSASAFTYQGKACVWLASPQSSPLPLRLSGKSAARRVWRRGRASGRRSKRPSSTSLAFSVSRAQTGGTWTPWWQGVATFE